MGNFEAEWSNSMQQLPDPKLVFKPRGKPQGKTPKNIYHASFPDHVQPLRRKGCISKHGNWQTKTSCSSDGNISLTHGTMLSTPQSTIMGIINVMLDIAAMLRLLVLHNGVSLAAPHPLLPSMTSPVFLILERIPNLVYFSPRSAIA